MLSRLNNINNRIFKYCINKCENIITNYTHLVTYKNKTLFFVRRYFDFLLQNMLL